MQAPASKADIGLYIPADVLRLDYPLATRFVLAEAISLHQSGGECTASDGHFVKRLGISRDTASRAVQQLVADGLLDRAYSDTGRYGITRYLTPTGDYPQIQAGQGGGDYPQNQAGTTRKIRQGLPAKSGANTTIEVNREVNTPPYPRAASRRVGGAAEISQKEDQHDAGECGPAAGGAGQAAGTVTDCSSTTPPPETVPAAQNDDQARADFAAFWEAWPTKQRRKDAAAAFGNLPAADRQQAAARAVRWLAQHPRQVARGAVPFPANWLRAEMWTDGPEPPDHTPKPGQPPPPPTTARTTARKDPDWK